MLVVKVKKLEENALIPSRGSDTSAGLDLYSCETKIIEPWKRELIDTGISISMPDNTYMRIAPRSGMSSKNGIDVMAGVVDLEYRGRIKVLLINLSDTPYEVLAGDRVAQGIITPIMLIPAVEVDSLDDTARGPSGFGSSGR